MPALVYSTAQELIDRARAHARQKTVGFYADSDVELLGWASEGLAQMHSRLRGSLRGQLPRPDHPYWRELYRTATKALVSGTTDYALDFDTSEPVDVWVGLFDTTSGLPLHPYALSQEHMIKRGSVLGIGSGAGRYAFLPSRQVRVLVVPGAEGVPKDTRTLTQHYYTGMPRFTAVADPLPLPDNELLDPAAWYMVASMQAARQAQAQPFFELFATLTDAIAQS